jgi:precorrin-2 dehydrogenase/sirohydrochlorin ferrochelatase
VSCFYPIFADISGRRVVVVGGGRVAAHKVKALLDCSGQVVVVSPEVTEKLAELGRCGRIELIRRGYQDGDIEDAWLVIAACDDEAVNKAVFSEANRLGIFCNVVDDPPLCSFIVPSQLVRGDLQIAVSTGGVSPMLAVAIRGQLEGEFGEYYEMFLTGLKELREHVKNKYPDGPDSRARILKEFIDSSAIELLRCGKADEFRDLLEQWKQR